MSRVSIVILILIILGFIMTIQRDGPSVISGDPSATGATGDNDKKGEQNRARKSKTMKNIKTDVVSSTSNSTVASKQIADKSPLMTEKIDILEGGEHLGLQVHRELARLSCFTGTVKKRWGRTSRAAVRRFNRVSRFSWPDWPSRDLVKSLGNYPDAYCKKCRDGGGEGCEIANTNAPTDESAKPASRSEPEVVTSTSPNSPFGAAKSAAKQASERERAGKEQAVREKAATDASGYLPPREMHRASRIDEPRRRSTKRRARSRRRKTHEKPSWTKRRRRSVARRQQRKRADTEPYRKRHPRHWVWEGNWSPWESGVGR